MKVIKIIERDELEDKLLHTSGIISDELSDLTVKYQKTLASSYPPIEDDSPKTEKWYGRCIELEDKCEKRILKKIFDYLIEEND